MDWATNEVALYLNGVKATTTLTTDKWKNYDSNYDWEAGHRMNTSGGRSDLAEGYFDDTAFLPVALTEAEVQNLYNNRNTV
jgi:hypothetical protein